jgi:hypothetical protein
MQFETVRSDLLDLKALVLPVVRQQQPQEAVAQLPEGSHLLLQAMQELDHLEGLLGTLSIRVNWVIIPHSLFLYLRMSQVRHLSYN